MSNHNHDQEMDLAMTRIGVLRFRLEEAMAEINRLRASSFVTAVPSEEYERLLSENKLVREESDRLKAEVERLTKAIEGSSYYFMSIKLNVENARLRKAGDAMERSLAFEYPDSPKVKDWNAAKEGKPSV